MSRFNGDEYDPQFPNEYDLWDANFQRHIRGARGQRDLRDLRDALISLPEKRLISGRLADEQGCVCTVGALALHRRKIAGEAPETVLADLAAVIAPDQWGDFDEWESEERTMDLGVEIGLKRMLAIKLASLNDDAWVAPVDETPEARYERVLAWVESRIKVAA